MNVTTLPRPARSHDNGHQAEKNGTSRFLRLKTQPCRVLRKQSMVVQCAVSQEYFTIFFVGPNSDGKRGCREAVLVSFFGPRRDILLKVSSNV